MNTILASFELDLTYLVSVRGIVLLVSVGAAVM